MHLENIPKLARHLPVILIKFILPQFHLAVTSDGIDGCDVFNSKVEHVECRIPPGTDIAGNHALSDLEILKDRKPLR